MPQLAHFAGFQHSSPASKMPFGTSGSSETLARAYLRITSDQRRSYEANLYPLDIPESLALTLSKITSLLTWPDGWNGYNALAPHPMAVLDAWNWIRLFYQEILTSSQDWLNPGVTASADGEVVLEWRQGIKRLTIYVGNQSVEYVKSWGPDITTEMADGSADSTRVRLSLWKWFMD